MATTAVHAIRRTAVIGFLVVAALVALSGCASNPERHTHSPGCFDIVEAYRDWDHTHTDYQIRTKNWWCEQDHDF
jgi:hypothetical protein